MTVHNKNAYRTPCWYFSILACLVLGLFISNAVHARGQYLGFWGSLYPDSRSDESGCQLCHQSLSGGNGWNYYGWTIRETLAGNTNVAEQFFSLQARSIEGLSSIDPDGLTDPESAAAEPTFAQEIANGAQPGWREGEVNVVRFRNGSQQDPQVPPSELCGRIDADSTPIPCAIDDPRPSAIVTGDIAVELEVVFDNLISPILIAKQPGNSSDLFVVTQGGQIWRMQEGSDARAIYLDVSDLLVSDYALPFGDIGFDERGLLGFAFDPDFQNNGRFYTYISKDAVSGTPDFTVQELGDEDHFSVISRWTITDSQSSPVQATEQEILTIQQPQFNHNGGTLVFGPDGYLYISVGDGGGANDDGDGHSEGGNGQDPSNPLGTVLRIDVAGSNSANGLYGIPADNPFIGQAEVDEAIATGFRNPFRFSIDDPINADTDDFDIYVGDVGQNEIEEIDLIRSNQLGGNYGWRFKEGSFFFIFNDAEPFISDVPPPDVEIGTLVDPIAEYDHDEGISVIGGHVYRGSAIEPLSGKYVFADYSRLFNQPNGRLFYLDEANEIKEFSIQIPPPYYFTGISEGHANELYVMGNQDIDVRSDTGVVLKLQAVAEQDEVLCLPLRAANGKTAVICL